MCVYDRGLYFEDYGIYLNKHVKLLSFYKILINNNEIPFNQNYPFLFNGSILLCENQYVKNIIINSGYYYTNTNLKQLYDKC